MLLAWTARNALAKMGGDLLESDTGGEYPISDLEKHITVHTDADKLV